MCVGEGNPSVGSDPGAAWGRPVPTGRPHDEPHPRAVAEAPSPPKRPRNSRRVVPRMANPPKYSAGGRGREPEPKLNSNPHPKP